MQWAAVAGLLWCVNQSGRQAVGYFYDGDDGFFNAAEISPSETETPTRAETNLSTASNKKAQTTSRKYLENRGKIY